MTTTVFDVTRITNAYDDEEATALFARPAPEEPAHTALLGYAREMIELRLPSDVRRLAEAVRYLVERAAHFGVVRQRDINLSIALDEALVNALRHGNQCDPAKTVRVSADISTHRARFTISDEGQGFDPARLLKVRGRGLALMRQCVDVVRYNTRGNAVMLIKYVARGGNQ